LLTGAAASTIEQDAQLNKHLLPIMPSQRLSQTLKNTKNDKKQSGRGYVPWEDIWNQKLLKKQVSRTRIFVPMLRNNVCTITDAGLGSWESISTLAKIRD
jgi:hypothetical protein